MGKVGLLLIGGVTVLVAYIGFNYYINKQLERESQAFANLVIPSISRRFELDNVIRYASSDLKEMYSAEELSAMIGDYQHFGRFLRFSGAHGELEQSYSFLKGDARSTLADYEATVVFSHTEASFILKLIKKPFGSWSILEFKLYPIYSEPRLTHGTVVIFKNAQFGKNDRLAEQNA